MRLPSTVQRIADVIGREKALYLVGQLPTCTTGNRSRRVMLYVPKELKPGHMLAALIGEEAARMLVEAFPGECMQLGTCAELRKDFYDRTALEWIAEGQQPAAICEVLGLSAYQVRTLQKAQVAQKPANDNYPALWTARKPTQSPNGRS